MCNCDECEQWMQPYMDRVLTDAERAEAEAHLNDCAYCRKRYRFEVDLIRADQSYPCHPCSIVIFATHIHGLI